MNSAIENIAYQYYDEDTYKHVHRVAEIAEGLAAQYPDIDKSIIRNVSLMHDILGDTSFPIYELHLYLKPEEIIALGHLARGNNMSHPQYIQHIIAANNKYSNIVKCAELLDYIINTQEHDLPASIINLYRQGLEKLEQSQEAE